MTQPFRFGGLSLAPLDLEGATRWILGRALERRASVVVTSNIAHFPLMRRERAFREIVTHAELNVADGWPLVLANRIVGGPRLPGRVAGVDLVAAVLASDVRLRVAILGGPPGAAALLAESIGNVHDVVAIDALVPGTWDQPAAQQTLRDAIRVAEPNLVLVAIGDPRQALLAESLRSVVHGPLICCGAAVEILAGQRRRAPKAFQALGLEWAYRAALEPGRLLPRYATSVPVFLRVLAAELRAKRSRDRDARTGTAAR